eukprot:TRINITY_DN13059_c0_g1_i3.p1 TRINITY_DN13059_c0_g1~~TRINITY_DN13059_c0_g1_i3.p1  ORF type:complete len:604 (-),score=134.45 TRINITY_DN13059_c0_g1_i3:33-1643(-)
MESFNLSTTLKDCKHVAKVFDVRIAKDPVTELTYSETLLENAGECLCDYVMGKAVSTSELSDYSHQVIEALSFAHEKKICHGSLRPEKIFVNNRIAKVIDFGGTLLIGTEGDGNMKKVINSWNGVYYPPDRYEILNVGLSKEEKREILFSFDIYSFGMIFYQLISKKQIIVLNREEELYKKSAISYKGFIKILSELADLHKSDEVFTKYFEALLKSVLEYERLRRPKIEGLYKKSVKSLEKLSKRDFEGEVTSEKEESKSDMDENSNPKLTCAICMKENKLGLKAKMECDHEVCEKCIKLAIKKAISENAASSLELNCHICRMKLKLTELNMKCKCHCIIEEFRDNCSSGILNLVNKRLCIAYCYNGHEITEEEAFVAFGPLRLNLKSEKIAREDIVIISNTLERLQYIEAVDLSQNQINAEGLNTLVSIYSGKESLRSFRVDWNPFGAEGGKHLKRLLEASKSLLTLSADTCQLGHKGISLLASGLESNATLKELSVEWNQIGAEGASAIAEAIRKHKSLRKIRLGSCCYYNLRI